MLVAADDYLKKMQWGKKYWLGTPLEQLSGQSLTYLSDHVSDGGIECTIVGYAEPMNVASCRVPSPSVVAIGFIRIRKTGGARSRQEAEKEEQESAMEASGHLICLGYRNANGSNSASDVW